DIPIQRVVIDDQMDIEETNLHRIGGVAGVVVDFGGGGEIGAFRKEIIVAVDDVDFKIVGVSIAVILDLGEINMNAHVETDIKPCFEGDGVGERREISARAGRADGKLVGVAAEVKIQIAIVGIRD